MLTAECLDAGEATVRRSAAAGVGLRCVAWRGVAGSMKEAFSSRPQHWHWSGLRAAGAGALFRCLAGPPGAAVDNFLCICTA